MTTFSSICDSGRFGGPNPRKHHHNLRRGLWMADPPIWSLLTWFLYPTRSCCPCSVETGCRPNPEWRVLFSLSWCFWFKYFISWHSLKNQNVVHRRRNSDVASEADVTTLAGVSVGQHWQEWRGFCFSSVTLCSLEALLVSDTRHTGNLCNHGNICVCSTPLTLSPTLWKHRNPQWGEVFVNTQSHPYILNCHLWGPHDPVLAFRGQSFFS